MLAHQPQDPLAADGEAAVGQAGADLAVPLAVEGVLASTARIAALSGHDQSVP